MIFNIFSKNYGRLLRDLISDEEVAKVAPSLVVTAHYRGKKILHEQFGESYAFYDWGSITKVVFLAGIWMRTMQTHGAEAKDLAQMYWPEYKNKNTTLEQLFTHTSGLTWWKPFYKKLLVLPKNKRYEVLEDWLRKEKLNSNKQAVYSDLDMLTLGVLLNKLHESSWLELWESYAADFPKWQAHYNLVGKSLFTPMQYAPTEKCEWRKKRLQGEAFDQNTWALGGVAPHAGLFGRIEDLDQWMLTLRKALLGDESTPFGDPKIAEQFVKRQITAAQGDFGFIFMKPSKVDSSAGKYFSADSFGHLGYTGTSTWFDPKRDLLVTILSNRLFNGDEKQPIRELRPKMHNLIVELLES